jgi:hypothetical protein
MILIFFDPPYPAQSPPEVVVGAADPLVELHSEQIEEEVEEADILEYLAMQEQDNAEMDFHGLDKTDKETSAWKEGDMPSLQDVSINA